MSINDTRLGGKSAFLRRHRGFGLAFARLIILIWTCSLLSLSSWNAPAWAAADTVQDQFVQKLQLPRNPESTLQDVLSRSEFKDSENESLMDKLRAWVFETVKKILAWIWEHIPSAKLPEAELDVFWTIMGSFVVAAVLVIIAVLVFHARKSFGRKKSEIQEIEEWSSTDAATSVGLLALALKSAEQGDFRGALINMFRHVLLWLDERGKLSLHEVKTNREVLESLRKDKRLRDALGPMIPVFNRVRYGNYPCGKHDYEEFVAMCSRVGDRT